MEKGSSLPPNKATLAKRPNIIQRKPVRQRIQQQERDSSMRKIAPIRLKERSFIATSSPSGGKLPIDELPRQKIPIKKDQIRR